MTLLCGIDWFVYAGTAGYWCLFDAEAFAFFAATGCERQITSWLLLQFWYSRPESMRWLEMQWICVRTYLRAHFRFSRFNCGKRDESHKGVGKKFCDWCQNPLKRTCRLHKSARTLFSMAQEPVFDKCKYHRHEFYENFFKQWQVF